MKSLKKIKRWYWRLNLQPYPDHWEFHTFSKRTANDFVETVNDLHGRILSNNRVELTMCTLKGNIEKPGWVITCTPLT